MYKTSKYGMKTAVHINAELKAIPKASINDLFLDDKKKITQKAVMVKEKVVGIVSPGYKLVQHDEAFRPVIDGITVSGEDKFKFNLFHTPSRAWINIFCGETHDGVNFGFSVINSVNGSSCIKYGFKANHVSTTIEVVGYRQVCSNGMKIRVPIHEAEFVKKEEIATLKRLLSKSVSFRHEGDVKDKILEMQFVVEAFLMLRLPLKRIIEKAQSIELSRATAHDFIEKYVGRRRLDKILEQYGKEEQTLWGLYNSITWYASHRDNLKITTSNHLLNQAATLLEKEMIVKA